MTAATVRRFFVACSAAVVALADGEGGGAAYETAKADADAALRELATAHATMRRVYRAVFHEAPP